MCHSHRNTVNAATAGHRGRESRGGGRPAAISGAAIRIRIMCWPTRAANSDTDSAHSGESSARAVTAQPVIASVRWRPPKRAR
ncbi:MAG: hypothetical protein BGO08_12060 [Altererythrobacter sp. 66-12]|nr:MAG: hypothetical protein BGO08_12060 [Altererythrobacter sp. 66-12]